MQATPVGEASLYDQDRLLIALVNTIILSHSSATAFGDTAVPIRTIENHQGKLQTAIGVTGLAALRHHFVTSFTDEEEKVARLKEYCDGVFRLTADGTGYARASKKVAAAAGCKSEEFQQYGIF
jgi:hypothetical protein